MMYGKGHQRAGAANQRDHAWDKVNQPRYGSTPIAVFQAIGGILDESAGAVQSRRGKGFGERRNTSVYGAVNARSQDLDQHVPLGGREK